ncbi:MAG: sulfite exporter TauE/SafE family protein [Firmicutes bacterium]|nr:sulfite exporter TauE/SafE family protein [Bacillota bacterium]
MIVFFIGILTGILSGLGIGGGTILIPSLVFFIKTNQQIAQSVNLIAFIPSSVVALIVHFKNKNIEKNMIKRLIVPGIAATCIGSLLAIKINSDMLKKIFSIFLFCMGIFEYISAKNFKKNN